MRLDQMPPWLRYAVPVTGLILIIYEALLYRGSPRYWLLVLYAGMIGLPSLFGSDKSHDDPDPPTPGAPLREEEPP